MLPAARLPVQLRLLEALAAHHHGPGHACDFVSKRNGSDLDRPTVHQASEPGPLRAVLARISDDSHGKCRLPCFEILPSLSLPPVECCLGTKPIHAARLRPEVNSFQSPTSATSAVATIGPTPGISSSRRLSSLERCQAWMRFSMATISALTTAYWRARTSRLNRAAAGMRSSCSSLMILSSSAVPLRPLAEIMPSSAMCPRMAFDSIVR